MGTEQYRPEIIIIAGPNGSGKTSVTKRLLKHQWSEGLLYINPDEIANDIFGDWNSNDAIIKAANYCELLRENCLEQKQSFVFETVMSSSAKVDFIIRAKLAGYFIRVFFIATKHPAINAARVANRVMQGGHDVPISKIVSRYTKSIANCKIISTIVDRLYVYDNSIDNADAKLLFRLTDGILAKKYTDQIENWAQEILP